MSLIDWFIDDNNNNNTNNVTEVTTKAPYNICYLYMAQPLLRTSGNEKT